MAEPPFTGRNVPDDPSKRVTDGDAGAPTVCGPALLANPCGRNWWQSLLFARFCPSNRPLAAVTWATSHGSGAAVRPGRHPDRALERLAERAHRVVPDPRGDLLHAVRGRAQHRRGLLHPPLDQVPDRGVPDQPG